MKLPPFQERTLLFGPSVSLEEQDEEGYLVSKRYDSSIEGVVRSTVRSLGGRCGGIVRMLGSAKFFREENQEDFDPEQEEVLLKIDGYSVARHAFGEGGFVWKISKQQLVVGDLKGARLIFESGT